MYQKAGQMFYDAYTVNPNNQDAIYKWYALWERKKGNEEKHKDN
jgi:hypothetical protein